MKKAISIVLSLTLIFNQVGAKCLANETAKSKNVTAQAEVQPKGNPQQSEENSQHVVDLVITEMQKREDEKKQQNKSSLPIRTLKWFGKAGAFVCKQFLWLITGSLMAIVGSVLETYTIFKYGFAGVKEAEKPFMNIMKTVENSLSEMNKLMDHLKANPDLRDDILNRMFSFLGSCKERMHPDEFNKFIRQLILLFHPDKLKNLRNISGEQAKDIYMRLSEFREQRR